MCQALFLNYTFLTCLTSAGFRASRCLWARIAINSVFKELESVEEERAVITGVGRVGDVVVEEMMFAKMWRQSVCQLS